MCIREKMYIWRFFKWLSERKYRKKYKGLPRGCWHCELLGVCRRTKKEGWRCYRGCLLIDKYKLNYFDKNL